MAHNLLEIRLGDRQIGDYSLRHKWGEERHEASIYLSYTTAVCKCAINKSCIKEAVLLLIPSFRPWAWVAYPNNMCISS